MERLRPDDPQYVGPWQVFNRLGSGGMGIVYLGNDGKRTAAIKIVRDFLLEDPASRERLNREVSSLKMVKSPYVAEIYEADTESNPAWIATYFVDGPSLKTLVDKEGPLSNGKWLELAHGLMSALESVHQTGIIHRDVKPSNILMTTSGPKLIDFGISLSSDATSLTQTGLVSGSPNWFAPEQFESDAVTYAIDNFAAGSVLYFAATGENPWGNEDTSIAKTMYSIINMEIDLSRLPEIQNLIISQLLKKSAKERARATDTLHQIGKSRIEISSPAIQTRKPQQKITKPRILLKGLTIGTVLIGLYFAYQLQPFMDNKSKIEADAEVSKVKRWSILVDGDTKPQKGIGDLYSIYLCDQEVREESLQLQELTSPPATVLPQFILLKGDARCGRNFDTILIEGSTDGSLPSRDYVLTGTTDTGFIIQYRFSISIS